MTAPLVMQQRVFRLTLRRLTTCGIVVELDIVHPTLRPLWVNRYRSFFAGPATKSAFVREPT